MSSNKNEKDLNVQPPMPINDETARYLWNLAQKSNLTVTTAMPAMTPKCVKQETNADPVERKPNPDDLTMSKVTANSNETPCLKNSGSLKMNWMEPKDIKKESKASGTSCAPNPFAALPLSLIKNGILSVTSDSACVEIENGVPILKETTDASMQPSCEPKSTITIEAVPMKKKSSSSAFNSKEKGQPKPAGIRQLAADARADEMKSTKAIPTPTLNSSENPVNIAQFQRKILLQRQILKSLIKQTGVQPLQSKSLVPNTNQTEFAALLGLELVTEFCLNDCKPTRKISNLDACTQCGTDFTPRWHCVSGSMEKYCERCFFWHMRLKNTEDRTKQYKMQVIMLQKSLKLPPTVKAVKPQSPVEPQELFKNYLQTLMNCVGNCHDRIIGLSDLTKLGASVAINPEVYKAMEHLRSLNSSATPETRAKAIQNLQLAFYKGLSDILKTSEVETQQKTTSLLRHYQLIVAHMAQKVGMTVGPSAQATQRRTGAPLEIFERAIREHKQRLLKSIQNTKT